jgi:acetate kinase
LILTINSGSTSVKLAAFTSSAGELTCIRSEHQDAPTDPQQLLRKFIAALPAVPLAAVAHRVVHGGTRFCEPTRIDDAVLEAIAALEPLAPLHNPPALVWIAAARRECGAEVPHIAVFDTAFFATLPQVAAAYAIPEALKVHGTVRRYGFHGIAHQSLWRRWCALRPDLKGGGRLISFQLGGGCSVAAIADGRPLDVSMGFSPLEGLVMATRSGDIDAAVVPYLAGELGLDDKTVIEKLNRESGLLGVSGKSSDLSALIADGGAQARFAVELYCYRAKKYLGSFLSVLGGCDGIVFGGGVGEHVPLVRQRIVEGMEWAGARMDLQRNERASSGEALLHAENSSIQIYALHVEEEISLASAARGMLIA